MPREQTRLVYQYDELSDEAKAKAREWMLRCEYDDWDGCENYDTFVQMLGFMGVTCSTHTVRLHSGKTREEPNFYWSLGNGDGFAFEGGWRADGVAMDKLVAEFGCGDLHAICATLMTVFLRFPQATCRIVTYGRDSTNLRVEDSESGETDDEGDPTELPEDVVSVLQEQSETLAHWCLQYLRDDLEDRTSDEAIEETIRANEYDFDEEGERA